MSEMNDSAGVVITLAGAAMPRYRCHKEVAALKIREVGSVPVPEWRNPVCRGSLDFGSACGHCERCEWLRNNPHQGAIIFPAEPGYAPFRVSAEYMRRHRPQPGGYFVVYADGYQSYSPAKAFEEGYARIEG